MKQLTIDGGKPGGGGVVSMGCLDDELVSVEIYLTKFPLFITLHRVVSEIPNIIQKAIWVLCPDLQCSDATPMVEVEVEIHAPFGFFTHVSGYSCTISSITSFFRTDI